MRRRLLEEIEKEIITLPNFVPSPPTRILNKADEKPSNYFLFVGVLEPHKGIMELLKVFDEIRRDRDCGLAVVGDGSLMRSVNQFIVSRSLADRVWYEGFVDDARLYSLYKNALALIVPSVWPENAPLVALEALSVGTPVIGANNGGLPEIVGKVDGRLLFDNWEGLKKIVVEFSRTQFPSNTVRQIYESNFSPGKYVNEYMKIIRGQSG
jgi:glycosyltransferase involved in cell wall biosynthesis